MTVESRGAIQRSLQALLNSGALGARTDAELLDLFQSRRDETSDEAFRILVDRHGAMVHAVCRRVLGGSSESDDAFQATFLVLVQKARSIRKGDSLGSWLHGVALRVARRARDQGRRRRALFHTMDHEALARHPGRNEDRDEASCAIHEEIERLPLRLREPLILCCLEGRTYEQAALALDLKEPSLRGRLHRGRKTLEARLRKRGELGWESLGLAARPSPGLVQAVKNLAPRSLDPSVPISDTVLSLAKGVTLAMSISAFKMTAVSALAGLCVVGTVVVAQQAGDSGREAEPQAGRDASKSTPHEPPAAPRPISKPEIEKLNAKILEALEQPFQADLPAPATLESLLKAIKAESMKPGYSGIAIYVDPACLSDEGLNLGAEVYGKVKDVPMRLALERTLNADKLSYCVQDGFLMIDSSLDIVQRRLDSVEKKIDRILKAIETPKPQS
jgi:RNA polymerase sigma factor (sigma-70 family)